MKKLLAVVLVLGMATTVFGAGIEMRIGQTDGVVGTDPTSGAPLVTLLPSQFVTIETWGTGLDSGLFGGVWGYNATTTPQGIEPFALEGVAPGPEMYGYSATGETLDTLGISVYTYPYITAPGDYLLATVTLHCSADGTLTIVSFDNLQGGAQLQKPDFSGYTIDFAASTIVIEQVPEPASLALLALGGLALIRRR